MVCEGQAAMTMNVVVPGEEALAVGPCGLDRPELSGEVGAVLQGLERRLADVRTLVVDVGGIGVAGCLINDDGICQPE